MKTCAKSCAKFSSVLAGIILCLSLGSKVWADVPPIVRKPTLALALAAAAVPKDSVVLAVAADKAELPEKAVPPTPASPLATLADAFGLVITPLETVTALVPPTMTVVYSPPDTPNPYVGMPPGKVLKLLTSGFQAVQWKAFLSPSGIGYSEMLNETQSRLFEALFPDGKLAVIEDNPNGPNDPKSARDFTGDTLKQAHLHLGYMIGLALQDTGKPDSHTFAGGGEVPGTPKRYFMTNALSSDVDHEFGAKVRETVPSTPKPGDFDFDTDALKVPIKVDGLKNVDDLMARIGAALHLELYADPRYGTRTVTLIGVPPTARAADLLRALAQCVAGTYRKVGPAYVLTDDVVGLGTRHALWKRFEDKAAALLPDGGNNVMQTGPTPENPYTIQDIDWGSDPLVFTPAQRRQFWGEWAKNPEQGGSGMLDLTVPYAQLSPAQQEAADLAQQDNEKNHLNTTIDGTVMVQAEPMLEITLPTLDGPVMVFQSYENLLPYPRLSPVQQTAQQVRVQANFPLSAEMSAAPPPSPLRPVVQRFAFRAVRIAPKTPDEVKRALAALKTLGFNEVWIQMTPTLKSDGDPAALSLLTLAVKEGKASGIAVFPDLRLLYWDTTTTAGLVDRAITGETMSQASLSARYPTGDAHDTVTPFAPEVWSRLTAWVSQIGAVPGISGLVWDDLVPSGYEARTSDSGDTSFGIPLGYTEAGRLASLRLLHADPVDLYTNYYSDIRADVHVPGLDDFNTERGLYDKWRALRTQTREALTRHLTESLPPSFSGPSRLPLLVPPANSTFSQRYGSWDDLRRPPPVVTYLSPHGPDGKVLMGVPMTEQMPSLLSYHVLETYGSPDAPDKTWAQSASLGLRQAVSGPDRNIVLDVTRKPSLLDSLADTERSFPASRGK